MRKFANMLFWVLLGVSVGSFAWGTLFSNGIDPAVSAWRAIGLLGFCLLLTFFEPGNKTGLQKIFLSIGAALVIATLTFGLGGWGWVGAGICAFMVATMKLDGGDSYRG